MRRRLIAYCTALFLNLAIVSGTLTVVEVEHPPIVRIRPRTRVTGRFSPGELLTDGSVAVLPLHAQRSAFHAN